jgi:hypothetical protein
MVFDNREVNIVQVLYTIHSCLFVKEYAEKVKSLKHENYRNTHEQCHLQTHAYTHYTLN